MSYKINSICLKCSLLALFLLFLQPVFAQYNFEELDQEFQNKQKLVGKDAILMLWKAGDTLIYKKDPGKTAQFNSKTSAPIGGLSKWLTAALVMVFVDEGKLSLDDKVSRWLPEFERYGKNYVTLEICLSHLTGIKDETNFLGRMFQKKKHSSLQEEVDDYASRAIRTNPGTDFWYGDMGINIAARVLEVISKKNFDILIKQKLLNPLAMRRTSFSSMVGGAVDPAGGATSTGDDYIKFLAMLMNKGKVGDKQVLSEESVEKLRTIHTNSIKMAYVPKEMTGYSYALASWAPEEKNGKATILMNPSFQGPCAIIDFCRGYAYLFMIKELLSEEKPNIHTSLKEVADAQLQAKCQ